MSEIWAILEHNEFAFHENSGELLAELTEVAQKQQQPTTVCAVILTSPEMPLPDTTFLTNLGIRSLYILDHPRLARFTTEGYTSAMAWLIQQHRPLLVATSASTNGRDWMPRLAARLHLPFIPGCLGLEMHDDAILALRSIYEGRAYIQTHTRLHERTALATFMPGIRGVPIKLPENLTSGSFLTITRLTPEISIDPGQERVRNIAIEAPSPEEVELDAAERIVAGGRGVGREGFTHISAFARLVGAAVGATRVATDRGWVEHARQIGATGKNVHPKLYIACGISGAAQHTSGMREAQTIVAINPDRTAPIFALADLGLLGDAKQILLLAADRIEQSSHT